MVTRALALHAAVTGVLCMALSYCTSPRHQRGAGTTSLPGERRRFTFFSPLTMKQLITWTSWRPLCSQVEHACKPRACGAKLNGNPSACARRGVDMHRKASHEFFAFATVLWLSARARVHGGGTAEAFGGLPGRARRRDGAAGAAPRTTAELPRGRLVAAGLRHRVVRRRLPLLWLAIVSLRTLAEPCWAVPRGPPPRRGGAGRPRRWPSSCRPRCPRSWGAGSGLGTRETRGRAGGGAGTMTTSGAAGSAKYTEGGGVHRGASRFSSASNRAINCMAHGMHGTVLC